MRKVVFIALLVAVLPAMTASAQSVAEKQMAQQIGIRLKQSGQLQNYRIGVKYHDGVALLEGTVTSPEQRQTAIRLAEQINGVSRVECNLDVPRQQFTGQSNAPNDGKSGNNTDRFQLAAALERSTQEAAHDESFGVVRAYQESNEMPQMAQRVPMRAAQGPPKKTGKSVVGMLGLKNKQMPVPSQTVPRMLPSRETHPMGVYQASGSCPTCNGGPMSGPGMGAGIGPGMGEMGGPGPTPAGFVPQGSGRGPSYDNASMPGYAWPSYASYPNYAALSYPKQYSPTAWPYIGPFYPYPQVPLAWRKVSLEWDDGWWFLDFSAHNSSH